MLADLGKFSFPLKPLQNSRQLLSFCWGQNFAFSTDRNDLWFKRSGLLMGIGGQQQLSSINLLLIT